MNASASRVSGNRPPGLIGVWSFLLVALLLVASWHWLRADPRFVGAAVLLSASRAVFAYNASESSQEAGPLAPPEELFQAAANGLTSVLDPFSTFMPPEEYGWFTEDAEGEYVGIGVEIKLTGGAAVIVHVFPQSAAADAMLRPGERIMAIDGVPTEGATMPAIVKRMRGPVDAPVTLRLESPGGDQREVTLLRRRVSVTPFPVSGVSLSGVAYVRWSEFSVGSADLLAALVEEYSVRSPIGLVIDLRGNPGGMLDEAVSAAGIFLPPGSLVCRLVHRDRSQPIDYVTATPPANYTGPVVMVLDAGSASASEVFAAALRDAGRAALVGSRSFGKGWVQSVFPYGDEGALRLSTGRYATPGGQVLGDPRQAAQSLATEDADSTLVGFGLAPDVAVLPAQAGVWERVLSQEGVFGDFAATFGDEWPATGSEDSQELGDRLRDWCDSLDIRPGVPGGALLDAWSRAARRGDQRVPPDVLDRLRVELAAARRADAELRFEQERPRLLLRLWEKHVLAVGRPDEGELEALFDIDPVLSSARDLLEEPERYQSITAQHAPPPVSMSWPDGPDRLSAVPRRPDNYECRRQSSVALVCPVGVFPVVGSPQKAADDVESHECARPAGWNEAGWDTIDRPSKGRYHYASGRVVGRVRRAERICPGS
ncbi:MAG: S41 family peptidase [Candidatus Zixiibacteriota bacterium]